MPQKWNSTNQKLRSAHRRNFPTQDRSYFLVSERGGCHIKTACVALKTMQSGKTMQNEGRTMQNCGKTLEDAKKNSGKWSNANQKQRSKHTGNFLHKTGAYFLASGSGGVTLRWHTPLSRPCNRGRLCKNEGRTMQNCGKTLEDPKKKSGKWSNANQKQRSKHTGSFPYREMFDEIVRKFGGKKHWTWHAASACVPSLGWIGTYN